MFKYVKFNKVAGEGTIHEFRGGDETVKVNHFNADIVSIEAENEADIDALISSQVSEISCETIAQEDFKDIVSSTAQFARIKEIAEEQYNKSVSLLTAQYPSFERETWATQLSQAKAFKTSGDEADALFLKTLADAEDDTVESFADAVIAKANKYESFMAVKLAEKRAIEKSLMSEIGL